MYLQMPSAQLSNLVNGITAGTLTSIQTIVPGAGGGNVGGLRLIEARQPADRQPAEYIGTNAALAALINTGARSISVPAGFTPAWLEIPVNWLATVLGTSANNVPTSGPLQLTSECALDARGGWEVFLQSIGWTPFTPSVFPLPLLNG